MILSVNEKKALLKRQRELEEYEEELVRRYADLRNDLQVQEMEEKARGAERAEAEKRYRQKQEL